MKKIGLIILLIGLIILLIGLIGLLPGYDDATIVRQNLEQAEQNFQVYRRCVFYNVFTGEYIMQVEGYLAIIIDSDDDLVVTVKTKEGLFMKHYFGHADNVTYFSEALIPSSVSDDSYKVIFKPSIILPTFEIR